MTDSLGDRMKRYESVSRNRLMSQVPVMGRLDGKAFHTFTRGMTKPYDENLQRCMWRTAIFLCENIQGCRLAYVQSDEITLILTQASPFEQGWFDFDIQKMASVAASWAGAAFFDRFLYEFGSLENRSIPAFDARWWNIPRHEIVNAFIWRQQDATRNSIQGLGQKYFSHKELHGKNQKDIQEMLWGYYEVNWNDLPIPEKRGVCVVKEAYGMEDSGAIRTHWVVDKEIPIFSEDRDYINDFLEPF